MGEERLRREIRMWKGGFGGKPWFSSESFTGLRAAEWQPEPSGESRPLACIEACGGIWAGIDQWRLPGDHLREQPSGHGSQRESVVRVAEREPQVGVPRGG